MEKKKYLKLLFPIILLTAMLSCLIPNCRAVWDGLLVEAGLAPFPGTLEEDRLYIHVIDVGKADAILVESPEAALLVDTGTEETAHEVKRYLVRRGITALNAVWISHGDSDHAGGLTDILEAVPAKEIVGSAYSSMPQLTRTVTVGDELTYGKLTIEVLGPIEKLETENNNSVVFRLSYGSFSMLFCGDVEEDAEQTLLFHGENLRADVLKVAHHGSDSSTSAAFLHAVKPQYAVISAGEDRNLLPRNAVIKRLQEADVKYYRTDLDGTIVIGTDGRTIEIITETTGNFSGDRKE